MRRATCCRSRKKDALKGWLTWGAGAHCVTEGQIKQRAPLLFHHISCFFFGSSTVNRCSLIEKKNNNLKLTPLLVTMNNDICHNTTFLFKWPMKAQSTKKQGQQCLSRLTADLWEVHGRETTLLSMSRYGLPPVAHKTQNFHRETMLRTWSDSTKLHVVCVMPVLSAVTVLRASASLLTTILLRGPMW